MISKEEPATTNVFTYGSLMYPEVIQKIVKQKYRSQQATLNGYERRQVKHRVYPGVTPNPTKHVKGIIYYNVSPQDMKELDYFQSLQYEHHNVQVITTSTGQKIKAIVYAYIDANNLENNEWRMQQFIKSHKQTFANSHIEYKQSLQKEE